MATTYFRADKRPFTPGEVIQTAGEFTLLNEFGVKAERALSIGRPTTKPDRKSCLMLFESEEDARDHCARMSGGRLYRVAVTEGALLHRGDMDLVDSIGGKVGEDAEVADLVAEYWLGNPASPHPCMELLASSGTVVEELHMTREERTNRVLKYFGMVPIAASE